MSKSWIYRVLVLVVISIVALSACAQATPTATPPPTDAPPTDAPLAVEPTEEATEVVAQAPTQEATEAITEEATEITTEEPTAEVTEVMTEEPTQEVMEVITEEPTEEATEIITEEPTAEVTEVMTEEPTEEATEVITEEPTEEATEVMTEEPTAEVTEVMTEEPTEEATEPASTLPTIAEIVSSDEDLSTLLAALEAADLVETLSGPGPFTVLAPTNAAFEAAYDALGVTEEDLLANTDLLTSILLYHVRSGELMAASIGAQTRLGTIGGEFINVELNDAGEIVLNGSVKITIENIEASNGIVHVIDAVLVPEAAQ